MLAHLVLKFRVGAEEVASAYNPNIQRPRGRRITTSFSPAYTTKWVPGQSRLDDEILLDNINDNTNLDY